MNGTEWESYIPNLELRHCEVDFGALRRMQRNLLSAKHPTDASPRIRRRRHFRPRFTWAAWLQDWYRALRVQGWEFCNKRRLDRRGYVSRKRLLRLETLYLYRRGTLLVLHPKSCGSEVDSVENVDLSLKKRIQKVFHIFRIPPEKRSNIRVRRSEEEPPYPVEYSGAHDKASESEIECIVNNYFQSSPRHEADRRYRRAFTYNVKTEKKLSALKLNGRDDFCSQKNGENSDTQETMYKRFMPYSVLPDERLRQSRRR